MPLAAPAPFIVRLDELGAPELYAKFQDPWEMPAAAQRPLGKALIMLRKLNQPGGYLEPEEQWALDALDNFASEALLEWNIPGADGKVAPVYFEPEPDSKNDERVKNPDPFATLHGYVWRYLIDKVTERLSSVPKRDRGR